MRTHLLSLTLFFIVCALGAAEAKPMHAFAWGLDELYKDRPAMVSPYKNITMFYWLDVNNISNVQQAKKALDIQPKGRRAIFDWDVHRKMYQNDADKLTTANGEKFTSLWWDHGVAETVKTYDAFFKEYKAAGGKLDYFVLDSEHGVGSDIYTAEQWEATAKDPRFKNFLKALNMKSVKDITDVQRPVNYWAYQNYLSAQYAEQLIAVVKKYYPNVKVSDYGFAYNKYNQYTAWGEWDRSGKTPGAQGIHVGTHQAPSLYGVITYLGGIEVDGKPFGLGPFRSLMLAVNDMRSSVLSSNVPLMPWIAWRGYVCDYVDSPNPPPYSSFGKTDYYQESIYHTALCNADDFLLWSAFRWQADQKVENWCNQDDLKLIDELISELNTMIGYADRKTLVKKMSPWHAPYLLTGMTANNQSVWRLTPDPEQQVDISLAAIKKSDSPLTFVIGDTQITMPGAKIYVSGKALSQAGYWIIGPENMKISEKKIK